MARLGLDWVLFPQSYLLIVNISLPPNRQLVVDTIAFEVLLLVNELKQLFAFGLDIQHCSVS